MEHGSFGSPAVQDTTRQPPRHETNPSERKHKMKKLLFSLAMVMILPCAVLASPPEAHQTRQQGWEQPQQGLEIYQLRTKEEQRRSWRQKYERDMKRLVERFRKAYPAGK